MKKISLVIGETASLPRELIKKYKMVFVPYVVDWRDGDNLPGENIFQKMKEAERQGIQTLPKTSQPSPWTFKKIFEEELKKSEKILCITLSSKISGGYNSACQGKEMLPKDYNPPTALPTKGWAPEQKRIYIIDSLSATVGEGLFVIKGAELIEKGKNIEEVLNELKDFIPKIHLFGMLGDPKWIEAGGRVSHPLAVLIRQMQKIGMRPLLGLKNGEVKPVALKMQARDVPTALFKELKKEVGRHPPTTQKKVRVAIGHADNSSAAQKLKEIIAKELPEIEIAFLNLIDSIMGVHIGPGSLVCSWHEIE